MAPGKRKKLSKNKKKNWKKTDVADVEEFLEEKRFEERIGGAVAEKSDEKLFVVDKVPTSIPEDLPTSSKKLEWLSKPLSCYRPLVNTSKVSSLHSGGKVGKPWNPKVKLKQSLKERVKPSGGCELYDIWSGQDSEMTHVPIHARKIPPKRPAALYKPTSVRPAVEVAHPGQSYNPSYEDHQDLLRNTLNTEIKKIKKETKDEREASKFKKLSRQEVERNWMVEMSSGLGEADAHDDVGDKPTDGERKIVRKMQQRKTRRDRNREKRRRATEVARGRLLRDKRKRNMLNRINSITQDVVGIQQTRAERLAARQEKREQEKDKPKRLGKVRYKEPMPAFKLSTELEGSLRLLKHTSRELLKDRFQSLLRRNVLVPSQRVKQKRSRKKSKWVLKREHREFEEKELAKMKEEEDD